MFPIYVLKFEFDFSKFQNKENQTMFNFIEYSMQFIKEYIQQYFQINLKIDNNNNNRGQSVKMNSPNFLVPAKRNVMTLF